MLKRIRRRFWLASAVGLGLAVVVMIGSACLVCGLSRGVPQAPLLVQAHQEAQAPKITHGPLRVMTLNLAHGRGEAFHQALIRSNAIRRNLESVAVLFRQVQPDVIAAQEADGPSVWSGQFDHVAFLARQAGYPWHARAENAKGAGLNWGTAILSARAPKQAAACTFRAVTPVTFSKGFTLATIEHDGREVDVVSVHLDYPNARLRQKQAGELVEYLAARKRPLVLMGDFNSDWHGRDSALRTVCEKLGLAVYQPLASGFVTFPFGQRRLDWICISPEFKFIQFRVLADRVSDHRAVMAVLEMAPAP